jgi:hypothetical protein
VADRADRDRLRPPDQACFVIRCGEPGELDHFADAELPSLERLGNQGQVLKGVARGDPPPRLPLGDAVADGEQVRGVARAGIAPDLATIGVGDQLEQLSLHSTDLRVDIVECTKQWCGATSNMSATLTPATDTRARRTVLIATTNDSRL